MCKVNGFFEEVNKSTYLTIFPTNEGKEKIQKCEELWSKIRNLVRSITKNLDDYDEQYMKIKFNSDDDLLLNTMIEIPGMIIVVRWLELFFIKVTNILVDNK